MPRSLSPFVLTLILACGGSGGGGLDAGTGPDDGRVPADVCVACDDAGTPPLDGGTSMDAGASLDATTTDGGQGGDPAPVVAARCGLSFEWLPTEGMGQVLERETPHGTLSVGGAVLAQLALANEGIDFDRTPEHDTQLYRVRYGTQDRGAARDATAMVVVPQVSEATELPVILFLHGTTGLNDACAPSNNLEDTESANYLNALLMSLISSWGYIVIAPDYLGQSSMAPSPELHPYLVAEPTALAAWDSVRAGLSLVEEEAPDLTAGPVVLWGASQGGHAAMVTAAFHSHYAPDIDLRGAVYGVVPSDLRAHMARGIRTLSPPSGNAVLFLVAADAWYGPPGGLADVVVDPLPTVLPTVLAEECSPNTLDSVVSTDEVFTEALRTASSSDMLEGIDPWSCYFRENSLTATSLLAPSVPALFLLGELDELVLTSIERDAFDTLCARGHSLTYLECAGAGHADGFIWAMDDALDFLDDRLAGTPQPNVCARQAATTCSNTP